MPAPVPLLSALRLAQGNRQMQDRAAVFETGFELVGLVADGVGGRPGGAEAATSLLEAVSRDVDRLLPVPFLQEMDMALAGVGETTAVLARISADRISGGVVGDSGAWLIGSRTHRVLTTVRKPYLGSGGAFPAPFRGQWEEPTLLMASDGLLRYTDPERIVKAASSSDLEEAAEALLALVRLPLSGEYPDDVSLILVRRAG